ncbi:MAG: hypothetical protein WCI63_00160 [bacterium]
MNCPKCGEELLNVNGKYLCSKCGIEVPEDQAVSGQPTVEPVVVESTEVTEVASPGAEENITPTPSAPNLAEPEIESNSSIPETVDISQPIVEAEVSQPAQPNPVSKMVQPEMESKEILNVPVEKTPEEGVAPIINPVESEAISAAEPSATVPSPVSETLVNNIAEPAMVTPVSPAPPNQETPPNISVATPTPTTQTMNTNLVQPPNASILTNQAVSSSPQEEEGLGKKKKMIIISAICGGGILFLIIGLLVGYFYNA